MRAALAVGEFLRRNALAQRKKLLPRDHARPHRIRHRHNVPQHRILRGPHVPHRLGEHGRIVRRAEAVDQKQHRRVGLPEHVTQFVRAVGRVDVHQHGPDPRAAELQQQPFGPVRRPDRDVLPLADAESDQRSGRAINVGVELAPRAAETISRRVLERRPAVGTEVAEDRRVPIGKPRRGPAENAAQRQAIDKWVRRIARVAHANPF